MTVMRDTRCLSAGRVAPDGALRLPYESSSPMGRRHFLVTTQAESVLRGSPYRADCPTRRILDRIGDRWTVLIVGALDVYGLRDAGLIEAGATVVSVAL